MVRDEARVGNQRLGHGVLLFFSSRGRGSWNFLSHLSFLPRNLFPVEMDQLGVTSVVYCLKNAM